MNPTDLQAAFDDGLRTGLFIGSLITGLLATVLWLARNTIQGRLNKLPMGDDWTEGKL